MNLGALADLIGPDMTMAEDRAVRAVRRYLRKFPGKKSRHACAELGINLDTYWDGRRKLGWSEDSYDPTDVASDQEAFSFTERVGDDLTPRERKVENQRKARARSLLYYYSNKAAKKASKSKTKTSDDLPEIPAAPTPS